MQQLPITATAQLYGWIFSIAVLIPGYYVTPQSPTVAIRAFDDVGINADFAKVFINGPVTMVHVVETDLKHNTDVSVNTFYPRL